MFSLISFMLYMFCTIIRPQAWVQGLIGQRLIFYTTLTTIAFLFLERIINPKNRWVKAPQNVFMTVFFIAIMLSHMRNLYLGGLIYSIKDFYKVVILYFFTINMVNSEGRLKFTIWYLVFLSAPLVIQGMHQRADGVGWAGQKMVGEGPDARITWVGIFGDPNDLALLFVFCIGVSISFIISRRTMFITKIFNAGLMLFFSYGIFMTNSRGGMLSTAVTLYFFFLKKTKRLILGSIIGLMMATVLLMFGPSRMSQVTSEEESAHNRIELWYGGFQMFQARPLFGYGYDRFQDFNPQTAHNTYILVLAELGFLGFYCWMGMVYFSYAGLSKIQEGCPELSTYALGIQSGLVGFCTGIMFLSRSYVILPYIIFSLSGGMMFLASQRNPELKFSLDKRNLKITFGISLGILFVIFVAVKLGI